MALILVQDKHSILKTVFGYSSFRPQQEEIIDYVIDGNDGLVIMPTGGGKSMCYQIPALVLDGMAIVVSPLIALMNDQVIALEQLGVPAAAIHSNHSEDALQQIVGRIKSRELKLLYVSPERLTNGRFIDFLKNQEISFIAIDEAHCVSVWGNDFRPDYAALSILKETFPKKNILALTATADKATQDDIVKQLNLSNAKTFISSFERTNILIQVRPGHDRKGQILSFLNKHEGESGIIYCLSRKSCEKVCADLRNAGVAAGYYHAGMDPQSRSKIQRRFQEDELQVVCATIAFGMGIDKSNIKWVIHYNMPKNLESYYQEIGRSGRDGSQARAILFYSWGDLVLYRNFIENGDGNEQFKFVQNAKLERMWEYVSTSDCRTNLILNYFGEYKSEKCNHCDNCINPPKKIDGKVIVQKAISAVVRCQQQVNIGLLIDILRGSNRREVMEGGFQNIKTYGAGRDLSYVAWKEYLTQIIDKGLLRIDYTDRLRLKMTPLSKVAISSSGPIMMKQYEVKEKGDKTKPKRGKKKTATEKLEEELASELKTWRLKKAQSMNVPAYVVLTDRSIEAIASHKPQNIYELEEVEGIGQKRIENYGDELLEMIQDYLRTQEHRSKLKGKTYLETYHLLKQGDTPAIIAEKRGIHLVTVFSHIAYLYSTGQQIDVWKYITKDQVELVNDAYIKSGKTEKLAELSEHLMVPVEFEKIRLAIAVIKKSV